MLKNPLVYLVCLSIVGTVGAAPRAQPALKGSDALPPVKINGDIAKIHTQGLLVTERHYYVTGRLEIEPKRAILLRFARQNLKAYEYIDITPEHSPRIGEPLDHPGGLDKGDGDLWIPVGRSQPKGPTIVLRVALRPNEPLAKQKPQVAFKVDDHIGAICFEPTMRLLYGANWDTKTIYAWEPNGKLNRKIERSKLVRENPEWQLAIQDWKGMGDLSLPGLVIAGGIDKSNAGPKNRSVAVVEFLNPRNGTSLRRIRFPQPKHVNRPVTNEGLAWHDGELFLLPEDIGRGAKILRYEMSQPEP